MDPPEEAEKPPLDARARRRKLAKVLTHPAVTIGLKLIIRYGWDIGAAIVHHWPF